jgi:hypothetical protein
MVRNKPKKNEIKNKKNERRHCKCDITGEVMHEEGEKDEVYRSLIFVFVDEEKTTSTGKKQYIPLSFFFGCCTTMEESEGQTEKGESNRLKYRPTSP